MITKQRIIITGSSGLLGTNLARSLREDRYNLVLVDIKPGSKDFSTVEGSFGDKKLMSKIIKKGDTVVHLACSSVPATSELDREKDINENIVGSVNLLDVCVEKKINKFIFASSGGTVYGDCGKKPIREDFNCSPINSHGVMKLTIEKFIQLYSKLYGLNYLIARPGNFYGRTGNKTRKQGVVDVFLGKIMNSEVIEIWGDGNMARDYIHIDDGVKFFVKAIKKSEHGIFNVGTGRGTTTNQVIKIIGKILGKRPKVKYLSSRNFDVRYNVLDISKSKKLLGWQPKIDLEKGIRKLADELK